MKRYRIIGKGGKITIPYETRLKMGFSYNDVISFEEKKDNTVVIKKEKICDSCKKDKVVFDEKHTDEITLLDFLDGLSVSEQRAALIHLTVNLAQLQSLKNV